VAKTPARDAMDEERWMNDIDFHAAANLYEQNFVIFEQHQGWHVYSPKMESTVI
jgi:hypothetical protein